MRDYGRGVVNTFFTHRDAKGTLQTCYPLHILVCVINSLFVVTTKPYRHHQL